jgi:hypothetical protein
VSKIAIAIYQLLNVALPQQLILVAIAGTCLFRPGPKLETLEENPPFAADTLGI